MILWGGCLSIPFHSMLNPLLMISDGLSEIGNSVCNYLFPIWAIHADLDRLL